MKHETANLNPSNQKLLKIGEVASLIALAIPLSAGKWGTYIGFYNQGIFFSDLFFLSACFIAVILKPQILLDNIILMSAIWIFIIFQFVRNPEYGIAPKLRDLAPFIYLGFYQPISFLLKGTNLKTIVTLVRISTLFHLIWSSAISLNVLQPISLPIFFGIPVFTTRWDQTGFVIAIGLVSWSAFPRLQLKGSNFVRFGFMFLAFSQGSRAGLLAFTAALMWLALHSFFWNEGTVVREKDTFLRILFIFGIIGSLLVPSLIKFLPENSVLGRIGILEISESARANATGTANDRKIAQQKLLEWVSSRNQSFVGVGPGVEMVYESGAFLNLSGARDVRSPHSWPIGALARFGITGFSFWLLLLYLISRYRLTDVKHPAFSWIIAILLTSLFGVIIESPFGSLPLIFFLCILRNNKRKI